MLDVNGKFWLRSGFDIFLEELRDSTEIEFYLRNNKVDIGPDGFEFELLYINNGVSFIDVFISYDDVKEILAVTERGIVAISKIRQLMIETIK